MKNTIYLFVLAISLIFILPAFAEEQNAAVAKISVAKNFVQIKTKTQEWHVARVNDNLFVGDQIRTASGSLAEVTFLNTGTKLRLSEFAQITVENQSNDVKLSFGKLFMAVVKGKGGMKVKSPVAVAAVLGTVGVVGYDPVATDKTKTYNVTSIDGNFAVTDNTTGNTVNVPAGNQVNLTPDGLITSVADVVNVIQSNPDVLQGQFIKVGLDAEHIKIDPVTGQEVIQLDTANPKEHIEMNVETGKTEVIEINNSNINNPTTNPTTNNTTVQPGQTPAPPTNTIPNLGQINNTIPVINQPTYNVPVTVF
jgi:preprotein translocase subunit YajC